METHLIHNSQTVSVKEATFPTEGLKLVSNLSTAEKAVLGQKNRFLTDPLNPAGHEPVTITVCHQVQFSKTGAIQSVKLDPIIIVEVFVLICVTLKTLNTNNKIISLLKICV